MSLFNSLNTSTSGVIAASRATNVTSQNVANMTTIGYKRSDTSFQDIVANSLFSTKTFNSGAVGTTKLLRATQQGQVQQTAYGTDAAIVGNGFFVVRDSLDAGDEFVFTRNGQFDNFTVRASEDTGALTTENSGEATYLRNSAGFFLYGWSIDQDGNVASSTDLSGLVPIEISMFQTQVLPTTNVDLSINLDASEEDYSPYLFVPAQTLPVSAQDAHFSRSVNVYDTLGGERQVTFEFRKITGPMAQITSNAGQSLSLSDVLVDNPTGPTPGITAGDTFTIANGAETLTVTFVNGTADTSAPAYEANTLADLRSIINNFTDTGGQAQFEARITDSGELLIQSALASESLDISASSPSVLGGTGFNIVPDPLDADYIYDPLFDINGTSTAYPGQNLFPAFDESDTPNTQGWWEVTVLIPDPSAPSGTATSIIRQGLINFNGDGTMNAVEDASGNIIIDMSTTPIDFDLATTGEELPFNVDISRFSQFSSGYNVIQAEQNGAGLGLQTGVTINDNGIVSAEFSNGMIVNIYQIPLAMFNNANGLIERSGTVFAQSADAGEVRLEIPGENGAGDIYGQAVESSNVDISNEFSNLIVHQRAFGLNSRVISTVDEMTQVLSRLKQ